MTKDELIKALLEWCQRHDGIESASLIAGEDTVGVELVDGAEYFITIEPA